MRKFLGI